MLLRYTMLVFYKVLYPMGPDDCSGVANLNVESI